MVFFGTGKIGLRQALTALFFFFVTGTAWTLTPGSKVSTDSLWAVWKNEKLADTLRLKALQKYYQQAYLYSKPDSAFLFAELQYKFAEKKGLMDFMADALKHQGITWHFRGDFAKALQYYERSLQLYRSLNHKPGVAAVSTNLGVFFSNQGEYPRALEYYLEALSLFETANDLNGISKCINNIGFIYLEQKDYTKALSYFQRSLTIKEKLKDKQGIANAYSNIGSVYNGLGDMVRSVEYYQKSLASERESGNVIGEIGIMIKLGYLYLQQGKYAEAGREFEQSLQRSKAQDNKMFQIASLLGFGSLYQKENAHRKAISNCATALKMLETVELLPSKRTACECLYQSYKAIGDQGRALEYFELMSETDRALEKEETTRQLERMEFRKIMREDSLQKVKRSQEIKAAHQQEIAVKNRTRNWLALSIVIILALAIAFFIRWKNVRKKKSTLEIIHQKSEKLLFNVLPPEIAGEIMDKGQTEARTLENVSILFSDFKGFTEQSAILDAKDLLSEINECFDAFDQIAERHGIEKIKTIGDAYMAAGGLTGHDGDSAKNTVLTALEMRDFISERKRENDLRQLPSFEMRIGIHTGNVVAGVVGRKKFQYDIWGDTVNTASRMESSGETGKVNVSEATYLKLKDDPDLVFTYRGKINAKGKGELDMYFVDRAI